MIMFLPIVFLPFILNFPSGLMIYWLTTNLWTTGQGLVTRRLMPKPQLPPKNARAHAAEGSASCRRTARAERRPAPHGSPSSGAPRRVKRKRGGRRPTVTERASSPSRPPARPSARRSGPRYASSSGCVPGLDRDAVQFQVVSEGERGLLGVGYTPARVVATAEPRRRRPPTPSPARARATTRRGCARSSSGSPHGIGVRRARSTIDESDEESSRVSCSGADLGAAHRQARPDDRRDPVPRERDRAPRPRRRARAVVVDAAGYRARRTRDARGARCAGRPSRRRATGQRGRARADDAGRAQDRPRGSSRTIPRSRRPARARSRTASSSSCRGTSRTGMDAYLERWLAAAARDAGR